MDTTLFLAQLLGLYFVIISVFVLVRRKTLSSIVNELARNKTALFALAAIEAVAGLSLVLAYPSITMDYVGLISLIGYMMVIEAIFYLFVPVRITKKILIKFNTPMWYGAGSVLGIVGGLYLLASGFGVL